MSRAFSIGCACPTARCRSLTTAALLGALLSLFSALCPTPGAAQVDGLAEDALPGLVQLPSALPAPYLAGVLRAGYGHTGEVLDTNDAHDRMLLEGAASLTPLPALSVGLRMGGHADWHRGMNSQNSDGFAASAALAVRGRVQVSRWAHLGLEAQARFPAAENRSSSLKAVTPQASAILSGQRETWMWTGTAGVRKNRQDRGFASTYLNDYESLALGNSDDWQVLLGVGGALKLGPVTGLAEVRWEPPLADGAKLRYAPLGLTAGVRGSPRPWLQLGASVDLSLSPYPPPARVSDVPVSPRIEVQGTVAFLWDGPGRSSASEESAGEPVESPAEPAPVAMLSGRIAGPDGQPVRDAAPQASLVGGDGASRELDVTAGTGAFEGEAPEAGRWELKVTALGYKPFSQSLDFPREEPVAVELERALPPGHVEVRVQDFRGRLVDASVVLLPARTPFESAGEKGTFGLDLAPGKYTIEVVAEGYSPEQRRAVVEENGVTIVVVDLRRRAER